MKTMRRDMEHIITYLAATTGIQLPETLYGQVEEFVVSRCQQQNVSIHEYITLLGNDGEEYARFIDSVTVNETYFFREESQFKVLEQHVLPELASSGRRVKLWSSSCSTGEEAVSLYLMAREILGHGSIDMYASDINASVLSDFASGVYKKNSFRRDGSTYHGLIEKYIQRDGDRVILNRDIIEDITRSVINLNFLPAEDLPSGFDIIFLRNTIIYFNIEERERIISGIVRHLREGGILFSSVTEVALVGSPELTVDVIDPVYFFRRKTVEEKKQGTVITEPLIEQIVLEYPEEKPVPETLHMHSVLTMANKKLNNPLFHLPANSNYRAGLDLLEYIYLVNHGRTDEAEMIIDRLQNVPVEEVLIFYLRGMLHRHRDEPIAALDFYDRVLNLAADVWPARFNRAMLLIQRENRVRGMADLSRTIKDIDAYIEHGEYHYQVFMDGFNGKYFRAICTGWMEKLGQTG